MTLNQPDSLSNIPKIRIRFGSVCLVISFMLFSLMGWLRLGTTLSGQGLIRELQAAPGVTYLAVTGGLWGVLGILATMGYFSRLKWGLRIAQACVILFPLTGWANAFWTANIQSTRLTGLSFFIGLTILWLALGLWILARANRERWFDLTI